MRLAPAAIEAALEGILLGRGCPSAHAGKVAREVTRNSLEGTYTHGINRFSRLVRDIDRGVIDTRAVPTLEAAFGALERYDGHLGFGITNAWFAMARAADLAAEHGIGCVALGNTNHWLRAATYGYLACERGMAGICFTNTLPNMPAWGAADARLGNNPLVVAFPWKGGDVVVDMAMSQYSYGALELALLEERRMPTPAGFDADGNLTDEPGAVISSKRPLPTGYWKGSALSFALDVFAAGLSLGRTTSEVGELDGEYSLSQTFIAVDVGRIADPDRVERIVRGAVENLRASVPDGSGRPIVYGGQRLRDIRARNESEGIPVDERVWEEILAL
jgi:3-dehydro-L-gulonate 2-dehydrogenase